MRKLEKDLKNLPDVPVDRFKQTLRRELVAAMQPAPAYGLKAALVGTSLAAVAFAAMAVSFVIAPAVPSRLHAALLHDGAAGRMSEEMTPVSAPTSGPATAPAFTQGATPLTAEGAVQPAVLREFLERANAGAQRDRSFLESWYAQQSRPTRVKAVSGERILAIRQFELANGERVAVLTDLGAATTTRTVSPEGTPSGRTF
jgi:hypothetical protein